MQKLFTINNKIFYEINTTVLIPSKFNYNNEIKEFLNKNCNVFNTINIYSIEDIDDKLLEDFNCNYLKTKEDLTKIDNIKINILANLINNKKVYVFLNILSYLDDSFKYQLLNFLKKENKIIINYTHNIEEVLLLDYISVIHNNIFVMEGKKEDILKEEKILKNLGYKLPFIVELSSGLKHYNLIDKIYYNTESLVDNLWK